MSDPRHQRTHPLCSLNLAACSHAKGCLQCDRTVTRCEVTIAAGRLSATTRSSLSRKTCAQAQLLRLQALVKKRPACAQHAGPHASSNPCLPSRPFHPCRISFLSTQPPYPAAAEVLQVLQACGGHLCAQVSIHCAGPGLVSSARAPSGGFGIVPAWGSRLFYTTRLLTAHSMDGRGQICLVGQPNMLMQDHSPVNIRRNLCHTLIPAEPCEAQCKTLPGFCLDEQCTYTLLFLALLLGPGGNASGRWLSPLVRRDLGTRPALSAPCSPCPNCKHHFLNDCSCLQSRLCLI